MDEEGGGCRMGWTSGSIEATRMPHSRKSLSSSSFLVLIVTYWLS